MLVKEDKLINDDNKSIDLPANTQTIESEKNAIVVQTQPNNQKDLMNKTVNI